MASPEYVAVNLSAPVGRNPVVGVGLYVHDPVLFDEVTRVTVHRVVSTGVAPSEVAVYPVMAMVPVVTVPANCGASVTVYVMDWP